jgi:hypothetical protein
MGTVTARVTDSGGRTASASVAYTVGSPLLLGATAPPAETAASLAAFPAIRYMRDFGDDGPDADALPELPAHNSLKMTVPSTVTVHVGWKDDVEELSTWMNGLTRPILLTWYHEPMGNISPTAYKATATRMVQIISGHPKRSLILGNGPVATRYWLDEGAGNPDDWAYPGMSFYGVDCYNGWNDRYRTAAQMFGVVFGKLRAKYPGIKLVIPEYAAERATTDPSGQGRAQMMRDHVAYLRAQPDVLACAWWNKGGDKITGLEPEQSTWRQLLQGA